MSFLPNGYKSPIIRRSKFFITTKPFTGKDAKCPRCGRLHKLEEGEFIKSKIKWQYVTCKDSRTYLIV